MYVAVQTVPWYRTKLKNKLYRRRSDLLLSSVNVEGNGKLKACQIIVVEDDTEIGELILEAFSMELDCDVKLIANGASALDWLKSDQCEMSVPTLIMLDIHLPGASGLDILNYVKSQQRFKNTRVVMSSSDSILLQQAREKADLVMLKPVGYSHFLEITRWFRRGYEEKDGRYEATRFAGS